MKRLSIRNLRQEKSQISMEFIVLGSLILIAIMIYALYSATEGQKAIADASLIDARNTLSTLADNVCSQGVGSRQSARISIPHLSADDTYISGNTINLAYRYDNKVSDYDAVSKCQLSGNLPFVKGVYDIVAYHWKNGHVRIGLQNDTSGPGLECTINPFPYHPMPNVTLDGVMVTQPIIDCRTDEDAECRISCTNNTYDNMVGNFAWNMTGSLIRHSFGPLINATHRCPGVPGNATPPNNLGLPEGVNHTYYITCKDPIGNAMGSSFNLTFVIDSWSCNYVNERSLWFFQQPLKLDETTKDPLQPLQPLDPSMAIYHHDASLTGSEPGYYCYQSSVVLPLRANVTRVKVQLNNSGGSEFSIVGYPVVQGGVYENYRKYARSAYLFQVFYPMTSPLSHFMPPYFSLRMYQRFTWLFYTFAGKQGIPPPWGFTLEGPPSAPPSQPWGFGYQHDFIGGENLLHHYLKAVTGGSQQGVFGPGGDEPEDPFTYVTEETDSFLVPYSIYNHSIPLYNRSLLNDLTFTLDGIALFNEGPLANWGASHPLTQNTGIRCNVDMLTADFDRDGDDDVIAVCSGRLYFFRNDGALDWQTLGDNSIFHDGNAKQKARMNITDIEMADFDNDGDLDIFAVNSARQEVLAYINKGNFSGWSESPTDGIEEYYPSTPFYAYSLGFKKIVLPRVHPGSCSHNCDIFEGFDIVKLRDIDGRGKEDIIVARKYMDYGSGNIAQQGMLTEGSEAIVVLGFYLKY